MFNLSASGEIAKSNVINCYHFNNQRGAEDGIFINIIPSFQIILNKSVSWCAKSDIVQV